ncbi:MAG: hypothetical protein ACI9AR_000556 [Flavobacteriaceae bacterium]|jgi:hypothetical protein
MNRSGDPATAVSIRANTARAAYLKEIKESTKKNPSGNVVPIFSGHIPSTNTTALSELLMNKEFVVTYFNKKTGKVTFSLVIDSNYVTEKEFTLFSSNEDGVLPRVGDVVIIENGKNDQDDDEIFFVKK